jgi:hypothetical protein
MALDKGLEDEHPFGNLAQMSEEEIAAIIKLIPKNETPSVWSYVEDWEEATKVAIEIGAKEGKVVDGRLTVEAGKMRKLALEKVLQKAEELKEPWLSNIKKSIKSGTIAKDYPSLSDFSGFVASAIEEELHGRVIDK